MVLLLGPPGAGKGTQSAELVSNLDATHVNSGRLLRSAAKDHGSTAQAIRDHSASGTLVPDSIVVELMRVALAEAESDWIVVDGFPKTRAQARRLDELLHTLNVDISVAFHLRADLAVLRERLAARGHTSGRQDDDLATIDRRLASLGVTPPDLLDWYQARGQLVEIDAAQPVDIVAGRILAELRAQQ